MRTLAILLAGIGAAAWAFGQTAADRAPTAESTCAQCHSLRLVRSQRLSRAAWDRELTKMTGWGWSGSAEDRAALLDFLAANYGDDKPAAPPERSADGRK